MAGASAWPAKSIAAARAASASGDTGALGTGGVAAAGSAGGCARNRGVVTHNVGRPAALREPDIYLFSREESPPVTGPMAGFMAGHRSRITTTTLRLLRRAAGWAFRPNILTGSGPAQRPRVWAAV